MELRKATKEDIDDFVDFHEPNLNSLKVKSEKVITKEQLLGYLEYIEKSWHVWKD